MEILNKDIIEQWILPHLALGKRGFTSKVPVYQIVMVILYRLKTGCQWRQLPVKHFFEHQRLTWQGVYYYFNRWSKLGCWQQLWIHLLAQHHAYLDLSSAQLDGSHTLAKNGREAIGYQTRKAAKTTNSLLLSDNQGLMLAMATPQEGQHHDLYEIQTLFEQLTQLVFPRKSGGNPTLMATVNVADGKMLHHLLNPTRTEDDFCGFIQQTCQPLLANPQAEVLLLADQLNTHLLESLVRWVAQQIGFTGELGKKDHQGILHDQPSLMAFLEDNTHRIRFVFTPKHASWLNPVENWFAKPQRHVIINGKFSSVKELIDKIENYLCYYNDYLSKPLNWKFKDFTKDKPLLNVNCQAFST